MKAFFDFLKLIIVLGITCAAAAGALALVYLITKEPIDKFKVEEEKKARRAVLPAAEEFKALFDEKKAEEEGAKFTGRKAWAALAGGKTIGYVLSGKTQGYGGPIEFMFGIDLEKRVTGVKITAQTETAGLGARIIDPAFLAQYRGRGRELLELKKSKGGDLQKLMAGSFYSFPAGRSGDPGLDAITGATISSRAVTRGVRESLAAFLQGDAASGASAEVKK